MCPLGLHLCSPLDSRTTKLTRGCPEVVNGSVGSDRGRNPTTLHHPREANPWRSFSSSVAEREKTEEEDDAVKIYEQRWFVRARRLRIISPTVVFSLLLEMRGFVLNDHQSRDSSS
ncbi:hypothetical protein Bca4012_099143 [Brassica carinata]